MSICNSGCRRHEKYLENSLHAEFQNVLRILFLSNNNLLEENYSGKNDWHLRASEGCVPTYNTLQNDGIHQRWPFAQSVGKVFFSEYYEFL